MELTTLPSTSTEAFLTLYSTAFISNPAVAGNTVESTTYFGG